MTGINGSARERALGHREHRLHARVPFVPAAASAIAAPHCVIVIGNDAAVRHSLSFRLAAEGFDVAAYDVAAAASAERLLPVAACAVVDHELPGASGLDYLVGVRRRGHRLPAFLTVWEIASHHRARARDWQIAVLHKPLHGDLLEVAIRRAIA